MCIGFFDDDHVPVRESPVEVQENEPMQLDSKEKMTYTEQAAKRMHCQRLTRLLIKSAITCTEN